MIKLYLTLLGILFSLNLSASDFSLIQQDLKQIESISKSSSFLANEFEKIISPILRKFDLNKNYVMSFNEESLLKNYYIRLSQMHFRLLEIHEMHSEICSNDSYYPERYLIRYLASAMIVASSMPLIRDIWNHKILNTILNDISTDIIQEGSFFVLQNTVFRELNTAFLLPIDYIYYAITYKTDEQHFLDIMNYFDFKGSPFYSDLKILMSNLITQEDVINVQKPFFKAVGNFEKQIFLSSLTKPITYYRQLFKIVSDWIGDTKIKRIDTSIHYGKTLIRESQIPAMEKLLLPGDVLVSRGNWFLSNLFLPSFWPHAFIYLGDVDKLIKYFDDENVINFFEQTCDDQSFQCNSFITYLKVKYPKAWMNYLSKDSHGKTRVTIEAISEGVLFSAAQGTLLADYVAAFRPKLSKLDIALAIDQAFSHWGKSYDYDFDFRTEKTIVCSELVYRSYLPALSRDKNGLLFRFSNDSDSYVKKIMGKVAMASGAIVQKAYDENVLNLRPSQLDFIFYMKGDEKLKFAKFESETALYRTALASKLSVIYQPRD